MKLDSRFLLTLIVTGLLAVTATWAAEVHLNDAKDGRTLTGPRSGDAEAVALDFVQANLERLQLTELDIADLQISDRYRTRHNGVTHLYWLQRHNGIPVHNGLLGVNVLADGSILNAHHRLVPNLAAKVNGAGPALAPEVAVTRAAEHIGLGERLTTLRQLDAQGGPTQQITLSEASISRDPIPVELRYQELEDGRVVLTWRLVIHRIDTPDWLDLRVDAATGEVVGIDNWTAHGGNEYRVYPLPADSPNTGTHDLIPSAADATASPFGWHDTDGTAGAEFTDTRGNNVFAQEDLDANDVGGSRPDGGAGLSFDFAHDDTIDPEDGTNVDASITNLFYYNNVMHDITYHYGFDEASGNFQENNYGNGGSAGDPVQADALDGSGTDNANFTTPPDGFDPRMQMFRFTSPPSLIVNSPPAIAGTYVAGSANFGAELDEIGVTGDLKLADDGVGTTSDACEALPAGSMTGMVAVIDRGNCEFGLKVLNAEDAGAIAAIVVNNQGNATTTMGPGVNGGSVTISSVFIGQGHGELIKAELPGVNATMVVGGFADRDSDFDNGIIGHEYGHGISNRLTGGPNQVGCLTTNIPGGTSEQAGEGWSDFWTLVLSARPEHTATQSRGVGNYVSYFDDDGPGIRNAPYSTDMSINEIHDYANVATINAPHGVGEIWMSAVWEMYWNLVERYGFDPDFYGGSGGNNLAIQLVIDGMKLQPCSPTMVDARDAILAADVANNGGANACEIWTGFAKRGLGENADAGTFLGNDQTPDYTVPNGVVCAVVFTDGFESGDTSAWSNTVN